MTDLIALVTSDNGSWKHVQKLVETGGFDRVFLIGNTVAKNNFTYTTESKVEFVTINAALPILQIIETVTSLLRPEIRFGEVGLSLASGNGKEHMAVLSAVMKLGVGFRLVAATKEGISEI